MEPLSAFETERLKMRITNSEDAAFILALMNTPKWLKYIGDRKIKTKKDAAAYIEKKMLPQFRKLGYSNYTVIRKFDHIKMGTCGLYDRKGLEGIDIGFAFLPEYEGKGYAFESAVKLKEIALSRLNIKQLSGITIKENTDSQRLLEKIGLRYKETIEMEGDEAKLLLYTL